MNKDFTIVIPSSNRNMQEEVYQHIVSQFKEGCHNRVLKLDGSNYPSFSKLVNDSILLSKTEIVIICSDRCKPSTDHINKVLNLLDEGYGFVGLHRFAFFGLTKNLVKKIGFFDENYIGGNFEDCDYIRRIREADIAYYEKEEVPYRFGASRWPLNVSFQKNKKYFESKWYEDDKFIKRLKPDPALDYEIGETTERFFLPWENSSLLPPSAGFMDKK